MLKSEVQAMMVSYFLPPKRKKFKKVNLLLHYEFSDWTELNHGGIRFHSRYMLETIFVLSVNYKQI